MLTVESRLSQQQFSFIAIRAYPGMFARHGLLSNTIRVEHVVACVANQEPVFIVGGATHMAGLVSSHGCAVWQQHKQSRKKAKQMRAGNGGGEHSNAECGLAETVQLKLLAQYVCAAPDHSSESSSDGSQSGSSLLAAGSLERAVQKERLLDDKLASLSQPEQSSEEMAHPMPQQGGQCLA